MKAPSRIANPFPGLRPFETEEYLLFFGREGQADELLARLGRTRFLAVVGTSGSGKSSLVRAGLLPSLRGGLMREAGSSWRVALMRPGSDPVGNLAAALAERGVLAEAGGGLEGAEAEAVVEATLRGGSLGLVEAARQARLAAHENLLVVVDQFEELFRFRAVRAAGRGHVGRRRGLRQAPARSRAAARAARLRRAHDALGFSRRLRAVPGLARGDQRRPVPHPAHDARRAARRHHRPRDGRARARRRAAGQPPPQRRGRQPRPVAHPPARADADVGLLEAAPPRLGAGLGRALRGHRRRWRTRSRATPTRRGTSWRTSASGQSPSGCSRRSPRRAPTTARFAARRV